MHLLVARQRRQVLLDAPAKAREVLLEALEAPGDGLSPWRAAEVAEAVRDTGAAGSSPKKQPSPSRNRTPRSPGSVIGARLRHATCPR
ncbi:MAG TPA: hypothetical protein VNN80_33885 [Polyangiaceae bacterium]|nr:hypothetical protein [Polyangiaceae bacterium]